ncbi:MULTISPECIES: NAD(P)/FAD-dependent oxidoreductase [unclassified Variovorax]|uniref:FAD-dependent oxidoreductase n=1 Tax=unclassified Variovorax TaxID=663243 RepID=UPI00076CBD08|nr:MULTISPECIES: NAD(P)/FAD-dependent oxidoreductase [unclassified Variovorax]KWT71357.1 putative oxidoreductase/monooxygenase [Variovorax sp. WDL1]PNG59647.1 FAD-dependent urate hydroxylase [Variovorax sp. B4]PNG60562.1 FAD-dependent urate hydroxylase [Variovorax sp. B2]VTV13551.1 Lysine/ornithine N-monooxygenase [Variovorax sp. WDL1]
MPNDASTPALPPVPPQFTTSPRDAAALETLAIRARAELERINVPPPAWMLPAESATDTRPVLDVLVAGAGMCGQTAAFALRREGLANIRVIDRAARGEEGPWGTYARMLTLRSPKQVGGPELGVPSLSFRAWYEAQHGGEGWQALHKIGRIDWRDYLLWVRDTVGLAVDNGVSLRSVSHGEGGRLLSIELEGPGGRRETVQARQLVLALGRDGSGAPRWPDFPTLRRDDPLAAGRVFHSADAIDFAALEGKRIGVLGAGASAFDNAGSALEAGAAEVQLFARRPQLPQVNKSKAASSHGFLRGFEGLDDARKWRVYTYIFDEQVPPPWESVRRCDAHAAFTLRLGTPWLDVVPGEGGVTVALLDGGSERFDAVIFATGFDVDLLDRPETGRYTPLIDTWARHVPSEEARRHPEPARFPYLGPGFELRALAPCPPDAAAALSRMRLFNWGATMSHGALAGDIPGLAIGATRLAQAIARDLFVEDADRHWARLQAHDEPELIATRWYVPGGSVE